ncbi:restriction endonuclease subunit S [Magnetovirga frankeli]|uniref:restriction endonuclease subunit S n=1 Tax=Magnetovirga frankeli TaxID=947516 RepID=UPI001293C5EA|nr:restriction endonuclease subunit S [gamma proteobacterium SS-5]
MTKHQLTGMEVLELQELTDPERPITYGVVKPGPEDPETGVIFIRGGDISNGTINEANLRTITQEVSRPYARTILRGGEVVMSLVGNPGEVAVVPDRLAGANLARQAGLIALRPEINAPYIKYYLMAPQGRGELFQRTQGAVQQVINLSDLKRVKVRLPAGQIQQRIANILSAYDDLIENNRRRIQLLEQAARLLYKEWFVHLRFPGHEHTQIIDGVPEGWEKKVLGDLCFEVRETVSPSAFEANTPYIGLEHMPRRSITLCEWGQAEQVTSSKHRFREGEILFGKIRPYFHKVGIAFTDGVASSDAIIIRPVHSHLLPLVLMTTSSDGFVAVTAQQMKEGSKMPRADWKQMQQYPVPLPPDGLLRAFNDFIDPILNQLKTLAFANQRLTKARDLLLPKLMNGEVAV